MNAPAPRLLDRSKRLHPHPVAARDGLLFRRMAVALLFLHVLAAVAAARFLVMLHGDGAWFVYVLTVDEPWALKWQSIAARATVFTTTVLPTQILAHGLDLDPIETARINGLIFYGMPGVLLALAAKIVWRSRPELLLFVCLQSVVSFGLCFGFPSEILLAPGFLWLALFLAQNKGVTPSFLIAYTALVFCHELALPAVIVTASYAWRQTIRAKSGRKARLAAVAMLAIPVLAMILVRMAGGGEGSDTNALFVFDPRRVLNNPTLWLALAAACLAVLVDLKLGFDRTTRSLLAYAFLGALLCLFAYELMPSMNFAAGRYDGRSLVALSMFILALVFSRYQKVVEGSSVQDLQPMQAYSPSSRWLLIVAAIAGVMAVSASIFLSDWALALKGQRDLIVGAHPDRRLPVFLSSEHALAVMQPEAARANRRMGFAWVYPYRSLILADGRTPDRIIVGDGRYARYCAQSFALKLKPGPHNPEVFRQWRDYSCKYVDPDGRDTVSKRFLRYLRSLVP